MAPVVELSSRLFKIVFKASELQMGDLMGGDHFEPRKVILFVGVMIHNWRKEYFAAIS